MDGRGLKKALTERCVVKPDNRTSDQLSSEEQEMRQATHDFYTGKGFPLHLYKKLTGGSIRIHPTPEKQRKYVQTQAS